MKNKRELVNRSCQDRRQNDASPWPNGERRKKEEKREQWQRAGRWRSTHKPLKVVDLSHTTLI